MIIFKPSAHRQAGAYLWVDISVVLVPQITFSLVLALVLDFPKIIVSISSSTP